LTLGVYSGFPLSGAKIFSKPNTFMPPTSFKFPGIVEHHYTFCTWPLPKISRFQKDQGYLLGTRLRNAALEMLEYLINASVSEGATKEEWLMKASQSLEHVRFQLRLTTQSR
jgi:hypothetical protein